MRERRKWYEMMFLFEVGAEEVGEEGVPLVVLLVEKVRKDITSVCAVDLMIFFVYATGGDHLIRQSPISSARVFTFHQLHISRTSKFHICSS